MTSPPAAGSHGATSWRGLAVSAALLGLSAVLLGAMGSHAIKLEDATAQKRWDIALQIHCFQAAALMALAALSASGVTAGKLRMPGWLQIAGTLVFCGSLYLRAAQLDWLPGWLTPAGGLILLLGWLGTVVALLISPKL